MCDIDQEEGAEDTPVKGQSVLPRGVRSVSFRGTRLAQGSSIRREAQRLKSQSEIDGKQAWGLES